jgi:uncharacterized LabA/DUF88 family protein
MRRLSGMDDVFHEASVALRKRGFEPHVVHELKELAERRKSTLRDTNIPEKAKGVDIGLSVRLLEDVYHNNFDVCYLFTSDIDFLPVIRVIQRLGKKVIVFGFGTGIGKRSALALTGESRGEMRPWPTKS